MQLRFRQRMFSWFDSYDIYDEAGNTVYTVKGQLSWRHCLKVYDGAGREIAMLKERVLTFLPKFEIYVGGNYLGCMAKEFSFFTPRYNIDFNGWHIEGNWMEWDYSILDSSGRNVASVSKELLHWTDTYMINVARREDALCALMVVLAVDAEKCSRNNG